MTGIVRITARTGVIELAPRPDAADAGLASALALYHAGQRERARAVLEPIVERHSTDAGALHLLGLIARDDGALDRSLDLLRRAVAAAPRVPEFHNSLGVLLQEAGRSDAALASLEEALALAPDFAFAHFNLGNTLLRAGRLADAVSSYERAIECDPDAAPTHLNRAIALVEQGRVEEALAGYERAVSLAPADARIHSCLLLCRHYRQTRETPDHFEAHARWAARHAADLHGVVRPAAQPVVGRALRIGYVSGDLHTHPVGLFLAPVLAAHDPARVEVHCFSSARENDALTASLRRDSHRWHEIGALSDAQAAERIARERIDVLVDLGGHSSSGRPLIAAYEPAPIVASWLGYVDTTGLDAVDYLIVDAAGVPDATAQRLSERPYRLPGTQWCYGLPRDAPPIGAPTRAARSVIFGCFNQIAKISDEVLEAWSAILEALPDARLMIKSRAFGDPATRDRQHARFVERGIPRARLELRPASARVDYLEELSAVDVVLDSFPYSGATVTCDALWMGVPVVTLAGSELVGRLAASPLYALGLGRCVADSRAAYVAAAIAIASDRDLRAALRRELRGRFADSTLGDAARFTRNIEHAYDAMCRRAVTGAP